MIESLCIYMEIPGARLLFEDIYGMELDLILDFLLSHFGLRTQLFADLIC